MQSKSKKGAQNTRKLDIDRKELSIVERWGQNLMPNLMRRQHMNGAEAEKTKAWFYEHFVFHPRAW